MSASAESDFEEVPQQSKETNFPAAPFADPSRIKTVDGRQVYTDADGIQFEYDVEKSAWFPVWNEDLISMQQKAYGSADLENLSDIFPERRIVDEESDDDSKQPEDAIKGKRKKQPESDVSKRNPNVYVTGLPLDATLEEIKGTFSKCGIIKEDIETGKPKIKLYTDQEGRFKGDALVCFFKEESVDLALTILDQSDFRSHKITVQHAVFDKKESLPPKKRKLDKQKIRAKMKKMEQKLGWYEEESGKRASKYSRIVILKHMFSPEEMESDPTVIFDLKDDVREECSKLGEVVSVEVFDKTPEGVCSVKFKDEEAAAKCIEIMNGRWFSGRRVSAEVYDGVVNYKALQKETDQEREARLKKYGDWLEQQAAEEKKQ